ncbi:MAG: hypothetical protein ACOC80_09175 [Petrotogales bacterium]
MSVLKVLDRIQVRYGLSERLRIVDYLNRLNPTKEEKEYTINLLGEFVDFPGIFVSENNMWEMEREVKEVCMK